MVKVDTIIPGGQALGTLDDGKKIFFWNALPGEIISEYEEGAPLLDKRPEQLGVEDFINLALIAEENNNK